MTRSYTLLECSNARLVEARQVAWEIEDKSKGSILQPTVGAAVVQVPRAFRS